MFYVLYFTPFAYFTNLTLFVTVKRVCVNISTNPVSKTNSLDGRTLGIA